MPRILVLSDVHGNLDALNAVLDDARGWDEVLVLGDLVDYGPEPGEVIDALRGLGARIVRGNHDHAVAYGVDCRCGEATHWISVWFREHVTNKLLSREDKAFLAALPEQLLLDLGGLGEALAVHGAPASRLYAYLYPWLREEEACRLLVPSARLTPRGTGECRPRRSLYLVGHTHHQFYRVIGGAVVANPGSAGQPRDGDPRAAYMLIDTDKASITMRRVRYPVENTVRKLKSLEIPSPYIDALTYMLVKARTPPPGMRAGAASDKR